MIKKNNLMDVDASIYLRRQMGCQAIRELETAKNRTKCGEWREYNLQIVNEKETRTNGTRKYIAGLSVRSHSPRFVECCRMNSFQPQNQFVQKTLRASFAFLSSYTHILSSIRLLIIWDAGDRGQDETLGSVHSFELLCHDMT